MSLLDDLFAFFRSEESTSANIEIWGEARSLFQDYMAEAETINSYNFDIEKMESAKKICQSEPEVQIQILKEAVRLDASGFRSQSLHVAYLSLTTKLLRRSLPLTEEDLLSLLIMSTSWGNARHYPDIALMVGTCVRFAETNELSVDVRNAIEMFREKHLGSSHHSAENRKFDKRLRLLLANADDAIPFAIEAHEAWGAKAISDIRALPDEDQLAWKKLLEHATGCSGTKPSAKWLKEVPKLIEKVGREKFVTFVEAWLSLVGKRGTFPGEPDRYSIDPNDTLSSDSADTLKGLAWMCTVDEDIHLTRAVGNAAEASFKKVVNVGPRCAKLGNACVGALSNLTSKDAIAALGRLKARVKHASARTQIEKALNHAAQKAGLTVQELEELNVPDYGFQEVGRYIHDFDSHKAEILIAGSEVEFNWMDAGGKPQKAAPAKVKSEHGEELKELKKTVGEVEKLLLTIRYRIENSLIGQRNWKFKDLKERYLDHPIAATVARRLIWSVNGKAGIWHDGKLVDAQNNPIATADDALCELWHPIASDPPEVLAWRQWLHQHQITQPFKQAHREIYVLTDAERATNNYSNRFAAHIIRQHQFSQLCQQRGWKYTLQGMWDSYNTPHLELPQWDLTVQFFVEPIMEDTAASHSGVYTHCTTDQVRFHHNRDGQLPLMEVMPIVFSEVMRDVDLFVGVCSVGNDPNWQDGGNQLYANYWQSYSFGDLSASAVTRKQVLQDVLPALKIAPRCHFEEKFLVVKGDIRTYKIHLGSGNILMEPNSEYLCIVPDRGTKGGTTQRVYLPFEGDGLMSVILSKAMMLADDTKIKDPSIVSQIKRSGILA